MTISSTVKDVGMNARTNPDLPTIGAFGNNLEDIDIDDPSTRCLKRVLHSFERLPNRKAAEKSIGQTDQNGAMPSAKFVP
jgi:hypothetical protein